VVSSRKRFAVVWRKAGLGLRAFVLTLGAILFALLVFVQRPEEEMGRATGSLLVLTLVNFIVVVIFVLAFLIGRNIVKLVFDRRRGILGSQLRTRLVVAFVGLILVPTAILFFLASGLLTRSMEGWFSSTVETAVNGAVDVARRHHAFLREYQADLSDHLSEQLVLRWKGFRSPEDLRQWTEGQRKRWRLFSIRIVGGDGAQAFETHNAVATLEPFREPDMDREALTQSLGGEPQVRFEERESSQFIRAYSRFEVSLPSSGQGGILPGARAPLALVLTLRVSPELTQTLSTVNESFREYEQLKLFRGSVKSNYILTLTMITGLILFSAVWIAFYIAREIAGPIQKLADATRLVAQGRDDIQIREVGDDEMGLLVRSFNKMTMDLRRSRSERERHRAFLETILENLGVGVIAIDTAGRVTSTNVAALETFGLDTSQLLEGLPLERVLSQQDIEQLKPVLERISQEPDLGVAPAIEKELMVRNGGRELKVVCTAGRIRGETGTPSGYVLLFDDVTELSKAQHMAAWREVAQRIAHEIKNPLTPIQLSAQRLEKLVHAEGLVIEGPVKEKGARENIRAKLIESTQTIVEHVDSIKRLANEFSEFARMPQADFAPASVNEIISAVVEPFATFHHDVVFQVIADNSIPPVSIDREQIRRVLINLIDNALAATRSSTTATSLSQGAKVTVRSSYDKRLRMASIEVADTGPGISAQDKLRVFEPYFTTKKGGTGLGLAIVTSIISDHQGRIRVFDNSPRGARFVIDLPLNPQRGTQRRFAA